MKPLPLLALLVFLGATAWTLTRSEESVRSIQYNYYKILGPIVKEGSSIGKYAKKFTQEVEHSRKLSLKLDAVEDDYGRLKVIERRFRDLERENKQLKAALDFQKTKPFDVIPAKIVKRQPASWWKTAIINRGENSGISIQFPVLARGGLVGKIERSYSGNLANVLLISDETCQVSVKIEGTPEVGILSGNSEPNSYGSEARLRLSFLSKDAKIKPGMKVTTTGRGGVFPPNISVGTIEAFYPGNFQGEAIVKPSVDLANLNVVFVLTGGQHEGLEASKKPI